jgi:hypothetical protein
MSNITISNSEELSNLPQLSFLELGTGVFEKPSKLGDILYCTAGKRKIVACDNANDIRFVESVMKRKGIAIRRVSPLINPSEINSVASWLQSKQDDFTIVCPSTVLLNLLDKHPSAYVLLYSPNPTEELVKYAEDKKDLKIIALASPSELSGFLVKCQNIHKNFSQICLEEGFLNQSILNFIKDKLSKIKTQTPGAMSSITKTIIEDSALSSSLLEKLLYFFLENTAGVVGESIDEELGICKASEEEQKQSRDRSEKNTSERKKPNYSKEESIDDEDEELEEEKPLSADRGRNDRNNKDRGRRDDRRDNDNRNPRNKDREERESEPRVKRMRYRFYVGLGEQHELGIQGMRDMLGDLIGPDCRVQRVHLRDNYSFVDMESQNLDDLLQAVSHVRYQGKLVHLDLAEEMGESFPHRGGNNRGGNYRGNNRGGGRNNNRNNNRRNYSR